MSGRGIWLAVGALAAAAAGVGAVVAHRSAGTGAESGLAAATPPAFRIGYTGSPLLAALYLAEKRPAWRGTDELVRFETSADVGYALIAGKVDAGFVEPAKALLIRDIREFRDIDVIGKVTYPYGGILVVRKGLHLRVQDLPGHTVAISEPGCKLYHALKKDLAWLKVDEARIRFEQLPFDAMLPALEAGQLDAAMTKASYSVLARKLGHDIPYVQLDIAAGDACCPAVVAQTEFLLLARRPARADARRLGQLLLEAQKEGDAALRAATQEQTAIPLAVLEASPSAVYSFADRLLLELFLKVEADEGAEKVGKR
jgi:ABC-type nitrate/sulfonate/bicarbonate transport system substrate-binding protein